MSKRTPHEPYLNILVPIHAKFPHYDSCTTSFKLEADQNILQNIQSHNEYTGLEFGAVFLSDKRSQYFFKVAKANLFLLQRVLFTLFFLFNYKYSPICINWKIFEVTVKKSLPTRSLKKTFKFQSSDEKGIIF